MPMTPRRRGSSSAVYVEHHVRRSASLLPDMADYLVAASRRRGRSGPTLTEARSMPASSTQLCMQHGCATVLFLESRTVAAHSLFPASISELR